MSCLQAQSEWTTWEKYTDSPGLEYRIKCNGPLFKGSKFTKWEVEVYNYYNKRVISEIVLINKDDKEVSEALEFDILKGKSKKIIFLRVDVDCQGSTLLKFNNIVLKK